MKQYFIIIPILILLIGAIHELPLHAEDSIVKVFPENIYPGDAFMLTVRSGDTPEAVIDGKKIHFSQIGGDAERRYIAIYPTLIDTSASVHEIIIKADKQLYKVVLTVQKKEFGQIDINLPKEKVFPSQQDLNRIKEEKETLDEVFQKITPPAWNGNFVLPIHNGVTTPFGVIRVLNGEKKSVHYGIDYKAALDEPIKAINSGTVVLARSLFFEGNTTIIDHGAGVYSVYMHMSRMTKKVGYHVDRYDLIGYAGKTGRATGPHLHLSVKVNGINVNPESIYVLPLSD